jgi:dimethylamine/trimethylamine dehydrogenase
MTPDELLRGALPRGPVLLFDDDGFYLGSVLAELLRRKGLEVTLVSPEDTIAPWTTNTLDYRHIQKRLRELGLRLITGHNLTGIEAGSARLACVYTERELLVECASVVLVCSRLPEDRLFHELQSREPEWAEAGIESVDRIGDCLAPGLIAHAVYSGHRYARELDGPPPADVPFLRVRAALD